MSRILAVGVATLDLIFTVAHYPSEDTEQRALSHRASRGGNASNILSVLAQCGHTCEFAGVLAVDEEARLVQQDFEMHGIGTQWCQRSQDGSTPVSSITLSRAAGSRTIVHYQSLPEYDFQAFTKIPLSDFDWLHFEGRNVRETSRMLRYARTCLTGQPISLEIEKPREGIEDLFDDADVLIFSKQYALSTGEDSPTAFLTRLSKRLSGKMVVLSWGHEGAWTMDGAGAIAQCAAQIQNEAIDTLGAGDVFNAGLIDALASGRTLEEAVECACRLAERKVGQNGFTDLFTP